jgi:hypothetical protein
MVTPPAFRTTRMLHWFAVTSTTVPVTVMSPENV